MAIKLFITGTDTGVGKTYITAELLRIFKKMGYSTIASKPVATDGFFKNGILCNDDALILQNTASIFLDYHLVNPFVFQEPIAPHIAASKINQSLDLKKIALETNKIFKIPSDIYIIEGIGGWHVPLNQFETMADFVMHFNLSVILVVGIKLGCLNHAILTAHAIIQSGLKLAGWIANFPSPDVAQSSDIIDALKKWIDAPCLGVVEHNEKQF